MGMEQAFEALFLILLFSGGISSVESALNKCLTNSVLFKRASLSKTECRLQGKKIDQEFDMFSGHCLIICLVK